MPGPIIIPVQNLPTVILLAIILIKVEQNIARTCKQSPEGIVVVRLLHIATIISVVVVVLPILWTVRNFVPSAA